MPGNRCTIAAWFSALLAMQLALASVEPDDFQRLLDQAAELNVQAPWHETQEILDELSTMLDQASHEQFVEYQIIRARTTALSGDMVGGLTLVEALLESGINAAEQHLHALALAANLAMLLRRFETAFSHLSSGLSLLPETVPDRPPVEFFGLAAYLYAEAGRLDKALYYGQRSMEWAEQVGDPRVTCGALQRLAHVYKVAGDHDAGIRRCRQAIDLCRDIGDDVIVGVLKHNLADMLRSNGNLEEAEATFGQSLEMLIPTGYAAGIDEARLGLARIHLKHGRHDPALELLLEVRGGFVQREAWNHLATTERLLAEIMHQRGDPAQAVTYLEAHLETFEKLHGRNQEIRMANLEMEFDTLFKEQEITLLQEGARLNALQTQTYRQSRQMQQIAYIVAIVLVPALFLLLWQALRDRRRYRKASERDSLTGLYNHTRFFDLAEQSFQLKRHQSQPFSLVLMDVDHFKLINDNYGHLAGDDALKQVGAWLIDTFSKHGIAGRIGGEEFAIALPDLDAESAANLVRASYAAFVAGAVDPDSPTLKASFGVAERTQELHLQSLRERADTALYRAKREGRDRVIIC